MTIVASNSLTISNVNDGTITHIAYAYSADGTDRFTTVYPNLNLIEDGKFAKPISSKWNTDGTTISKDDITGYFKVKFNGAGSLNRTYYTAGLSTIPIGQKYSVYIKAYSLESSINIKIGSVNTSQAVTVTNNSNIPKTYKAEGLVRGASDTFGIFGGLTTTLGTLFISEIKLEPGPTATLWMPSSSEVTTADYPSYIGQYTDFTQANSTNPSAYTWSLIRGKDGKDGKDGTNGTDGNPGKIVSDTEPTNKFKGLTWKYSGSADMTASDGTVILSGTEYYYSGSNWILNSINSHNINGDNLNVTNGTFTNGQIKSTWDSGTASGSTEIENSHINMSATDSSSKATNSLGLDVQQGLGMRWADPTSNQSRSVLLDYGNLSFDRNGVAAGLNFDGTNLSSSMPIQAPNTIVKSTQFSVSGIGIRLDRMMSFVAVTFSGQASSTITNSPTIINVLPDGFKPISPYSIDYMVPGNTANNGYIYFNPDGSIRIMATINSGYYIRGTRFYITNDVYPS